jgi:hypothetical protein
MKKSVSILHCAVLSQSLTCMHRIVLKQMYVHPNICIEIQITLFITTSLWVPNLGFAPCTHNNSPLTKYQLSKPFVTNFKTNIISREMIWYTKLLYKYFGLICMYCLLLILTVYFNSLLYGPWNCMVLFEC